MTTSINDIKESVNQLNLKVDKLTEKVELIINQFATITHLEAVAAKIINETQKEFQKHSCKEDMIEIKNKTNTTILDPKTEDKKPFIGKYSYPNYNVGNEELGSSRNPNSMTWPKDFFKPA